MDHGRPGTDPTETPGSWRAALTALGDVSGDGLAVTAAAGRLIGYNGPLATVWGLSPAALAEPSSDEELFALLAPQAAQPAAALESLRACASSAPDREYVVALRDARTVTFRSRALAAAGGVMGRLWTFRDVTEARRAAAALREAQDRVRILSAHADGLVFEFDRETRYVGIWASDGSLLARPEDELLGRTIVEALGEQEGRPFQDRVQRVFATGCEERFEYVLDVQGGRRAFAGDVVLTPPREGAPRTVTFLARDVTARVQMQAQLLQAERLASIGMLAAGVAHEINNPLAYMMLNLERLRAELRALAEQSPSPRLAALEESVRMTWEGAERVRSIVQDLRTFSRPDDGARTIVDLRRALDVASELAQGEIKHRARVVRSYDDVPVVCAGESRLTQLFVHLLFNAAHAIPEGRPELHEVRLATGTDARGWAVVEVRDTGRGMAHEVRERIFDPVFTCAETGLGVGLGLSVCHGIVTALGGEITVESEEGRGSAFTVRLPPAQQDPECADTAEEPEEAAPRPRVLVIDDEAAIGNAIRFALAQQCQVAAVTSARAALEKISGGDGFDLVLCDLMMPEMNGLDFYNELQRRAPEYLHRVVFMTGSDPTGAARATLEKRGGKLLGKPFTAAELRALVRARFRSADEAE